MFIWSSKKKLESLYLKHCHELSTFDIQIINQSWDIDFVKLLAEDLLSPSKIYLVNAMLEPLEHRDKDFVQEFKKKNYLNTVKNLKGINYLFIEMNEIFIIKRLYYFNIIF